MVSRAGVSSGPVAEGFWFWGAGFGVEVLIWGAGFGAKG